jgi:hypothetical protein
VTNQAIEQNEKLSYQLVLFTWNDGTESAAYTDWTSEIESEGVTYSPRPTMEVRIPKNTGDLGDESLTIDMSLEDGFLTDMSNGLPHAKVSVTVAEINRPTTAAPGTTRYTTFQGTIVLATRNINGKKGNVRLTGKTPKALMQVAMGQPANIQCSNALGDGRCTVDMSLGQNSFFSTLTSIDGRIVTVNVTGHTNPDPKYFHRGYFTRGGLRIMIRDWSDSDPLTFVLVRQPPASWLNGAVLISSGCDKSVETCRSRYDNEDHFNGPGFAMPGYLPIFESA